MWKFFYFITFMLSAQPAAYFVVFSDDQWEWLAASISLAAFVGLGPTIHDFRWQTGDARFFFRRLFVGALGVYGVTLFYLLVGKPLLNLM